MDIHPAEYDPEPGLCLYRDPDPAISLQEMTPGISMYVCNGVFYIDILKFETLRESASIYRALC